MRILIGISLIAFLSVAVYFVFFHPESRFDPETQIEFRGDTIKFRMSPADMMNKPYRARSEMLSAQVAAVITYVSQRTGYRHILDIVALIEPAGDRMLRIREKPDEPLRQSLLANFAFATNVRGHRPHDAFVARMTADLSANTDTSYSLEEYQRKMRGFSDTGFMRTRLDRGNIRFLANAMITRDIARNIIGDTPLRDELKLARLMDWVFVNASNHFVRSMPGFEEFGDYNDIPLELMIRGMGDCDRSAWVLARLARHVDMPAHVVYLHRPHQEGKVSFHTIAEVLTLSGWKAVDPFNNIIYPKSIAGMAQDSEYFKFSWIFVNHASAHAFLPIMKLAESVYNMYDRDQNLFVDIVARLKLFLKDEWGDHFKDEKIARILNLLHESYSVKLGQDDVSITRWEMPFWLRGYYYDNAYLAYKDLKLPFLSKIREARIAQLLGRYDEADSLFVQLDAMNDPDPRFYEERDYFKLLNAFYQGRYSEVERGVEAYRRKYPETPRNTMLRYILAHSLLKMNRPADAVAAYPYGRNFDGRGRIEPNLRHIKNSSS